MRGGQYARAGFAWLLATAAVSLAFTRTGELGPRAVMEFIVLFVFNLALTAMLAFFTYQGSRWFVIGEKEDVPDELAVQHLTIIMVTLAVASLAYRLLAFE
ncbi:MAG: hypothetical protein ACYC4L_08470 [Chloroflexota bacterium]